MQRSSLRRRIAIFAFAFVVAGSVAIAAVPPLRLVAMHFALSRVTLLHYEIDGDAVEVEGAVNGRSVGQFTRVLDDHPNIDTVVLRNVTGSIDDEATFEIARIIRARGLATIVPEGGLVESGGVDLFIAGATRHVSDDARLGVHEWQGFTSSATDNPTGAKEHDTYVVFYTEMLGAAAGEDFYWFTIQAAPPDGMHHLTGAEIDHYGLTTDPLHRSN